MKVEFFSVQAGVARDFRDAVTTGPVQLLVSTATYGLAFLPMRGGSIAGLRTEVLANSLAITSMNYSLELVNGQNLPTARYSELNFFTTDSGAQAFGFASGEMTRADTLGQNDNGNFAALYLTGNDTLIGSSAQNFLYAGSGNDRISGGDGGDLIDGGPGVDTSVYREHSRSEYLTSRQSNGIVRVADKYGATDANVSVEKLEFADSTIDTATLRYQPGYTEPTAGSVGTIFRFYNVRDNSYFYTNSVAERDNIVRESTDASYTPSNGVWPYFYQGATFEQAHSSGGQSPVFRFYNTQTGHHFFTTSQAERDLVLRESTDPNYGQPGLWPFAYEGVAFNAFSDPNHRDAQPVYRYFSAELNRHFFTGSLEEANQIALTGQWVYEGIGYWGETLG